MFFGELLLNFLPHRLKRPDCLSDPMVSVYDVCTDIYLVMVVLLFFVNLLIVIAVLIIIRFGRCWTHDISGKHVVVFLKVLIKGGVGVVSHVKDDF